MGLQFSLNILDSTTIAPWILGTLLLLLIFATAVAIRSWRDMKQSPYFFMRQQAGKRLQTYALSSLSLLVLTLLMAAFTLRQPPNLETVRSATLSNAKPTSTDVQALFAEAAASDVALTASDDLFAASSISTTDPDTNLAANDTGALFELTLTLPEEFDQLEPAVELREETDIGTLAFSTEINDEYTAVNPNNIFAEGSYTLYATFDYAEMTDGMVWSWVWRRDGEVINGGNEVWAYGADGPGYIYLNPEEGFLSGEYTLEVWINGELFTQSDMIVNTAAALANN